MSGIISGRTIGVIKEDTRSVDHSPLGQTGVPGRLLALKGHGKKYRRPFYHGAWASSRV